MLRATLLAVAAVLAFAGTADARSCPKHAVELRVQGHQRCLKIPAVRPATVRSRLIALADRAPLPRARSRRVRRAAASMRVVRRRLLRRVARARIASSDPEIAGGYEHAPEGQLGSGFSVTGTQGVTVGGQRIDVTVGMGDDKFVEACPRAGGLVPGRAGMHWALGAKGSLPHRFTVSEGMTMDGKAKLTGHVGADGKLRDYDMAAEVEFDLRRTVRGPAGLVHAGSDGARLHARFVLLGLQADTPIREWFDADHLSMEHVLSVLEPGAVMGKADGTAIVTITMLLKMNADFAMREAQKHYYDDAACLRADYALSTLRPGERRDVPVAVRSTVDGAAQSIDLDVTGVGLTVTPARVHAAPSAPARLTIRAPAREGGVGLKVDGTSVRGRVTATRNTVVEHPVIAWNYAVRLTGSGTYSEDDTYADATSAVEHHYITTFSFDDRWARVVLPVDRRPSPLPYATSSRGTLSGTATSQGSKHDDVNGDSRYTCTAPLADGNAQPGILPLTLEPGIVPGGARSSRSARRPRSRSVPEVA